MMKKIAGVATEKTTVKPATLKEVSPLFETLLERYGIRKGSDDCVIVSASTEFRIGLLNVFFGGSISQFDRLIGKRVLDLGCGSRYSPDNSFLGVRIRDFEPWLCRLLKEIGAFPVGIDLYELTGEPFEHFRMDLSKKGTLDFLPSASFDIINSYSFLSSDAEGVSPVFRRLNGNDHYGLREKMIEEFTQQALRLLKEGGIFVFEEEHFMKRNSRLEPFDKK